MRYSLAIAALVSATFAAPSYGQGHPPKDVEVVTNYHTVVKTVVHTVYVTEGESKPTQAPPSYDAPAVTTKYEEPKPTNDYPAYPAPSQEPPKPSQAPSPPASGYQGIVDTWRAKMGMKPLKNSAKLEGNAMDCVKSSAGKMVHKLNPGSYGQVLAPGGADDFEHVFVGGWLCEMPSLPGLGPQVCDEQSKGWSYQGQTGHAEILSSTQYSEIGCALASGIWACDLA